MHLKRVELSGFKSFAKMTTLEFSSAVTAIVGPNGSGKSNIAEGARWVLGEQSMKSLRGKKGEDLIFNGSNTQPRMSKASVNLVFDNTKRELPVEFEEVAVGRRVYRDGVNEYMLNDSQVRLKDIVSLMANVGIGPSQHNIIGQGESDRILYVSAGERKEMIEDALGLKIYHIKYQEAERKLLRTAENMKQVEAIRKEIQPHLKFLRNQVEKFEKAKEFRDDLEEKYRAYLEAEEAFLEHSSQGLDKKKKEPQEKLHGIEKRMRELRTTVEGERDGKPPADSGELNKIKSELSLFREKISKLERDLGRLEGIIEIESSRSPDEGNEQVAKEEVQAILSDIEETLSQALEESVAEQIYAFIQDAMGRISSFLSRIETDAEKDGESVKIDELTREKNKLEEALVGLALKEKECRQREKDISGALFEGERKLREAERTLFELTQKASVLKDALRSFDIEEERLKMYREEFHRQKEEAAHYIDVSNIPKAKEVILHEDRDKLRKAIDKLKFRLEESGGVDESILREYQDIESRDKFFAGEIEDLKKATGDLNSLSRELLEKLEHEFEEGIKKINKEFEKFFVIMFNGGRAELRYIKPRRSFDSLDRLGTSKLRAIKKDELDEEETEEDEKTVQEGVEVDVSLPRKKIRGLEMLSGGERALTSIALLFAFVRVNPPPFLVLDEIDAALDEANSRRYGDMIENLAKETQLILITHNRESMKRAGILYGVTMGRDGVSRLLSLKLEEAREYTI